MGVLCQLRAPEQVVLYIENKTIEIPTNTPRIGLSAYQTSKLSVLRLTEFVAKENEEAGLVAFSVHPGNTLSSILDYGKGMSDELKAVFTETPELVADGLVFLTKERRDWLTGRYVNITWDLPELVGQAMQERIEQGDFLKVKLVTPEVY